MNTRTVPVEIPVELIERLRYWADRYEAFWPRTNEEPNGITDTMRQAATALAAAPPQSEHCQCHYCIEAQLGDLGATVISVEPTVISLTGTPNFSGMFTTGAAVSTTLPGALTGGLTVSSGFVTNNAAGQDASAGENERPSRGCSPNAPVPAAPASTLPPCKGKNECHDDETEKRTWRIKPSVPISHLSSGPFCSGKSGDAAPTTMNLGERPDSKLPLSSEQIADFRGAYGHTERYRVLCDQALAAIELEQQLAGLKSEWFHRGQESVRRSNQSGCCCKISDDGATILSACNAHAEWAKQQLAEKDREIAEWQTKFEQISVVAMHNKGLAEQEHERAEKAGAERAFDNAAWQRDIERLKQAKAELAELTARSAAGFATLDCPACGLRINQPKLTGG